MSQEEFNRLPDLLALSRKNLRLGNPPLYVYDEGGRKYDRDLLLLSAQVRMAAALEDIAATLAEKKGASAEPEEALAAELNAGEGGAVDG